MNKSLITGAVVFSATAQAHTLEFLPDGLLHELLHMLPFAVPILLVGLLVKTRLRK